MLDTELKAIKERLESDDCKPFHFHARTDIAQLLAEVERLRDELKQAKKMEKIAYDLMVGITERYKKLRESNRWIPVTERLPEDSEKITKCDIAKIECLDVLVYGVKRYDGEGVYRTRRLRNVLTGKPIVDKAINIKWHWVGMDSVTHWMPLPQPPEKTEEVE